MIFGDVGGRGFHPTGTITVHALSSTVAAHAGGHGNGERHWQRHLPHDADRLHPAHHRDRRRAPTSGTPSYSGDTNNNAVSGTIAQASGRVAVAAASPTITTTPNPSTVTLGAAVGPPADPDRFGGLGGWLPPDRHDHLHAFHQWWHDAGGHGDRYRHRQWHLHHADGLLPCRSQGQSPARTSGTPPTTATPTTTRSATTARPTSRSRSARPAPRSPRPRARERSRPGAATPADHDRFGLGSPAAFTRPAPSPLRSSSTAVPRRWTRETVSVTGNGTYTTPTGFTLPTTGTVAGTYQWDASYGGESSSTTTRSATIARPASAVAVAAARPTITTTPSPRARSR